ncbi:MAG: type VII secretion integral membrane protein EccD [Mycobacterium sp.]
MPSEMCRVSIRAGSREVDLTLPVHIPLGEIVPATIDLVIANDNDLRAEFAGRAVDLCRVGVPPLDPSRSLAQSGVTDGDLLILTTQHITPPTYRFDPCSTIRDVTAAAPPGGPPLSKTYVTAGLLCWAGIAELCFLAGLLANGQQSHAVIAGMASTVASAVAAMAFRRNDASRILSAWSAVWAATFASVAGALAIPGHLSASHLLLAMSACSTTAFGLGRLLGCGTDVLLAISGSSGLAAVAAFGATLNWWAPVAVGPILVAASLAALPAGPRIAALIARLSPADVDEDELLERATQARGILSLWVTASSGSTALGCLLSATFGSGGVAEGFLILAAAIVLLSHIRRHRDPLPATALAVSGATAVTALLLFAASGDFGWAPWLFSGLIPLILAYVWVAVGTARPELPFGKQIAEGIEFAMATAVPPLACWAMGLFSAVRGMSLP